MAYHLHTKVVSFNHLRCEDLEGSYQKAYKNVAKGYIVSQYLSYLKWYWADILVSAIIFSADHGNDVAQSP